MAHVFRNSTPSCFVSHYLTPFILIVFSFVITCRLWFGDSFHCMTKSDVPTSFTNVHCYRTSVYTLNKRPEIDMLTDLKSKDHKYHYYYAWVNLTFLVQALLFYLPHLLWKYYEKDFISKLTSGVNKDGGRKDLELSVLSKYVVVTRGKHTFYFMLNIILEACTFIVAFLQLLWLEFFFQVSGSSIYQYEKWSDFETVNFPGQGKCTFHLYGASGDIQRHSALCLLPLNTLFMYMFLFLYAWYIFVTVTAGLQLVFRMAMVRKAEFLEAVYRVRSVPTDRQNVDSLCRKLSYGDWFFLSRLEGDLLDLDFAKLLEDLSKALSEGKPFEDGEEMERNQKEEDDVTSF